MLEFVCYFMPSFISIMIHKNILKEDKILNLVLNYGVYVALNNLFTLTIVNLRHGSQIVDFSAVNVTYCFKYLLMSTVVSIVLPYIMKIIVKNIEINVEVKANEKQETKKRK